MQALVIGGTGPTGPFIVNGLRERGYAVTILHTGKHEVPEIPQDVEHLHFSKGWTRPLVVNMFTSLYTSDK